MASMSKQDTYRLLMKDKKSKRSSVPKIDHPLAKYNSLGQLSCVICELLVKNELLWATHLQSKIHKQNVTKLKSINNKTQSTTTVPSFYPSPHSCTDNDGSVKPSLPPSRKRTHSDTNSINNEEDIPVSSKLIKEDTTVQMTDEVTRTEGLPSDFFDSPNTTSTTTGTTGTAGIATETAEIPIAKPQSDNAEKGSNKKDEGQSDLPEGFFDNPVQDAKVRKVEYKDPLDEQWEAFQKTISKESDVSEAIIENDDEEMKVGRERNEVEEQVYCYERAEKLRLKQESILMSRNVKVEPTEESIDRMEESDDETDLNDLFNWRFKSS